MIVVQDLFVGCVMDSECCEITSKTLALQARITRLGCEYNVKEGL